MILIAGGTGTLGTRTVRAINAGGAPVRVLTRDANRASELHAEIIVGDVRDPATLAPAMRGVTTVVSAIQGFAGVDPNGATAVDLRGNENLLRAAAAAGVQRFVLISAAGAAPNSPLELRRIKHQAETTALRSSMPTTIIRPTVYLETWLGILTEMVESKRAVTVFGHGDNPINFVSADDVAALIERATRSSDLAGTTLEIGGPENLTLNQLSRKVLARTQTPEKIHHVPLPLLRAAALLLRPIKPAIATLAQFGITMDTTDMTLTTDTARATIPDLPLTHPDDILTHASESGGGGEVF